MSQADDHRQASLDRCRVDFASRSCAAGPYQCRHSLAVVDDLDTCLASRNRDFLFEEIA